MSAEDRDRQQREMLRRLSDEATPGPWEIYQNMDAEVMATQVDRGPFGVTLRPATGREDYGRADMLLAVNAVNYVREVVLGAPAAADESPLVQRLRALVEAPFDCRAVVDENTHDAVPVEHIRALLPRSTT